MPDFKDEEFKFPDEVEIESKDSPEEKENDFELVSHTGLSTTLEHCYLDEKGLLYLKTSLGFGLVHTMDMWQAAQMLEMGQLLTTDIEQKDIPSLFSFVSSPQHNNVAQ